MVEKVVVVSGGFDPIHKGHVNLLKEAKKLGDKLVVIMNNDNWLKNWKEKGVFMKQEDRVEILKAIRHVDEVYITKHTLDKKDISVCEALREIKPDIFANGGDRFEDNIPEVKVCNELGIKMVFNVGGEKMESSSELVKRFKEK